MYIRRTLAKQRRRTKKRGRSHKGAMARRILRGGAAIKKIIYCFWTGTNAMSANRKACLDNLIATSGCKVQLVDPTNLQMFLLPDAPLHEAYQYLSATHKSDYLRTYFMHFLGGGYSDIKHTTADWNTAFDDLNAKPKMLLNGYHEPSSEGVAGDASVKEHWRELPGNCAYIIRPRTEFTQKWYDLLVQKLDSNIQALKQHPADSPHSTPETTHGYPIKWTEILGDIFHPLADTYRGQFLFTTPPPDLSKSWR
jgi:hypothetical protein